MASMKEKICTAALELFNEKGYDNVSLRDIAEAAGTTIGNLTYHFPQKDNLLAEIQERVQENFPVSTKYSDDPAEIMEQMIRSFFLAEKNERENSFYYENICEFYQDSDRVKNNVTSFRKKLFDNYYILFTTLRDLGAMRGEKAPKAYLNLAHLCVVMLTFWTSKMSPYHDENLPRISVTEAAYHLLEPYITDSYKDTFRDIYKKYSEKEWDL